MDKTKIDNLIIYLMAISSLAKDIHYTCEGDNFYGKHLFADKINENINEYIDQLKEICILGHGLRPAYSRYYLLETAEKLEYAAPDFKLMRNLLLLALGEIEGIDNLSKGDENLIGAIAQDLQNSLGLINIMYYKETK